MVLVLVQGLLLLSVQVVQRVSVTFGLCHCQHSSSPAGLEQNKTKSGLGQEAAMMLRCTSSIECNVQSQNKTFEFPVIPVTLIMTPGLLE